MTRPTGPALNGLEVTVLHQVPSDRGIRVKTIVWLIGKPPDIVRRTLQQLERLGYVTHAGGVWRRT
jgi:DNA-binding IclR family transcriptional regulator